MSAKSSRDYAGSNEIKSNEQSFNLDLIKI